MTCRYCSELHEWQECPRIESIEYFPDGTVSNVRFRDISYRVTPGTTPHLWPNGSPATKIEVGSSAPPVVNVN